MGYVNKAFILELSYRLTVAVNMSEHGLESLAWMSSWNDDTFACAQQWNKHLLASVVNNDPVGVMGIQIVNEIANGLSLGYAGLVGNAPGQNVHAYQLLLTEAHKFAHAPVFADWGLAEFYILGQQLAQNDLRAYYSASNKPELPIAVSAFPKFVPLPKESFPRSWPGWPIDSAFNDCLARYAANRQRFAGTASFSMGALANLALSIACPSHFPSTVWCWQDWEKGEPWRLFLAGRIFPAPVLVTVKDGNDKAFIALLEAMDRDKREGRAVDDCGWVPRNSLWPEKSSNTRSKAWSKLTRETLVILGEFEFDGDKGKNRKTGGNCRLPVAFAGSACRVFIEKLK